MLLLVNKINFVHLVYGFISTVRIISGYITHNFYIVLVPKTLLGIVGIYFQRCAIDINTAGFFGRKFREDDSAINIRYCSTENVVVGDQGIAVNKRVFNIVFR